MLLQTFKSDKWLEVSSGDRPTGFGGDLLPVTAVSPLGRAGRIVVPETPLEEEVLRDLLRKELLNLWRDVVPDFPSINARGAEGFAYCLLEWPEHAGGGLFSFADDADEGATGEFYLAVHVSGEEGPENSIRDRGLTLLFVMNGVAATDDRVGHPEAAHALNAMYSYWSRTSWGQDWMHAAGVR